MQDGLEQCVLPERMLFCTAQTTTARMLPSLMKYMKEGTALSAIMSICEGKTLMQALPLSAVPVAIQQAKKGLPVTAWRTEAKRGVQYSE